MNFNQIYIDALTRRMSETDTNTFTLSKKLELSPATLGRNLKGDTPMSLITFLKCAYALGYDETMWTIGKAVQGMKETITHDIINAENGNEVGIFFSGSEVVATSYSRGDVPSVSIQSRFYTNIPSEKWAQVMGVEKVNIFKNDR